jgi:hypothetical protein
MYYVKILQKLLKNKIFNEINKINKYKIKYEQKISTLPKQVFRCKYRPLSLE